MVDALRFLLHGFPVSAYSTPTLIEAIIYLSSSYSMRMVTETTACYPQPGLTIISHLWLDGSYVNQERVME